MTKRVRIEDADTADHQLVVQVWEKGVNGDPDTLADEVFLLGPTDMKELYVHATRYLVIKEAE